MLIEADLPEDAAALRALVLEQNRTITALTAERVDADAEMARLRAMLDAFMRHRFGARSEKLDPDQLQLGLENVETAVASAETANDAKSGTAAADRPRKRNRGALPAHLERIEQIVDIDSRQCPCCGGALHQIGEDVAERLDVVPTTFRVLVTRRPRYGCRSCEGAVIQAPAPQDCRGWAAHRGADRAHAGREVRRPPAALPPGPDLRPPGSPARPLDLG